MRTVRYLATCTMYGFLVALSSLQLVIFCIGYGEYRVWVLDRSILSLTIGDVVRTLEAQGDLQYG